MHHTPHAVNADVAIIPCARTLQIQKIMMDFEKESATMDMKEEMMSDAVDDAMDQEGEEEEEVEGDRILKEVLDEIGISIGQQVRLCTLSDFQLSGLADQRVSCTLLISSEKRLRPFKLRPTAHFLHQGLPSQRVPTVLQRLAAVAMAATVGEAERRRMPFRLGLTTLSGDLLVPLLALRTSTIFGRPSFPCTIGRTHTSWPPRAPDCLPSHETLSFMIFDDRMGRLENPFMA